MGQEMKPLVTSRGRYLCYVEKEIFRELILRKLKGRFNPWKIGGWVYLQSGLDVIRVLGLVCFSYNVWHSFTYFLTYCLLITKFILIAGCLYFFLLLYGKFYGPWNKNSYVFFMGKVITFKLILYHLFVELYIICDTSNIDMVCVHS
jgi:hypothetical protein